MMKLQSTVLLPVNYHFDLNIIEPNFIIILSSLIFSDTLICKFYSYYIIMIIIITVILTVCRQHHIGNHQVSLTSSLLPL